MKKLLIILLCLYSTQVFAFTCPDLVVEECRYNDNGLYVKSINSFMLVQNIMILYLREKGYRYKVSASFTSETRYVFIYKSFNDKIATVFLHDEIGVGERITILEIKH